LQFSLWCPEFPRKEGEDMLYGYIMHLQRHPDFYAFLFEMWAFHLIVNPDSVT
jgi:hypothetical protein